MRSNTRTIAVAAALMSALALASCSISESARPLAPGHVSHDLVATDTTPIRVNVDQVWSGSGNTYTYTAIPLDSTLPVTYAWLLSNCPGNVDPIDCTEPAQRSTSQSFTVTFPVYSSGTKSTIIAEVKQVGDGGRSGAKYLQHTIPAPNNGYFVGGFSCDLGSNYLWESQHYDPATGTFQTDSVTVPWNYPNAGARVAQTYRRNPCYGSKEMHY